MAIVKGPAFSLAASGNVGAICYSTHRGLQIVKSAWTGTVPNTTKQVVQQGYMTTVSQAWGGTLDADDRLTWTNLARSIVWRDRLGSPYIPNGYQLFLKWNIRRKVMGLAIMTIAPAVQERVYVHAMNAGVSAVHDRINMRMAKSDADNVDGYGVEFYKAGPYGSGGRHPIEGEWLFLARKVPPTLYADFDIIFDEWYWYRGRTISKFGDVGNWFERQVQFTF